jgi:hypothetical protein
MASVIDTGNEAAKVRIIGRIARPHQLLFMGITECIKGMFRW